VNLPGRIVIIAAALLAVLAVPASAQPLYRWVDEEGVVHFGDRVPPEHAARSRQLLNNQGVQVGFEQGVLSDEERAEQAAAAEREEQARRERAEIARRDRMLLETYLTVEDIEDLRDRRLELMGSQIQVTELYLSNLRKTLDGLNAEAARYKPYSDKEDAREIPPDLASQIARTESSITLYEESLARTRNEQAKTRDAFDSDIARFRELKGN
jgi:hypothetical protein